jgi:hypothetical protein
VEHCDKDGNIKKGTLTEEQARGLKKLAKRVKEGEIVITRTDKSERLFVSNTDDYREKGMVHVGNDKKISEEEVKKIQRRLNNLTQVWLRCFQCGATHGERNEARVKMAFITRAEVIPPLYTMEKDHKPWVEGTKWLPSKPVCGACAAANSGSPNWSEGLWKGSPMGYAGHARASPGRT